MTDREIVDNIIERFIKKSNESSVAKKSYTLSNIEHGLLSIMTKEEKEIYLNFIKQYNIKNVILQHDFTLDKTKCLCLGEKYFIGDKK